MYENSTKNIKETINDINSRLDNLVKLVDIKKNFFNNIFFPEKDREIPMNLYNIHYSPTGQDYDFLDNDENIKQYKFDQPDKVFMLPSSDDSGNEQSNDKNFAFNKICDEIFDIETLFTINDIEKDLPKNVHPILMLRVQEPFPSIEKMLSLIKNHIQKPPYEIKIVSINKKEQNKSIVSFIIKFNSLQDTLIIKDILTNQYKLNAHFLYDQRELNNAKWFCVVFRRESGNEQKLNRFVTLICDIFRAIPDKEKKFICNSVESTCEAKIEGDECIRKLGDMLYCAIKVNNLEQALILCLQYNKYYDMKVNLHKITFKLKKNKIPQILINKDIKGENKLQTHKIKKNFKEDDCFQNEVADLLFSKNKFLSRKHKRAKLNKASKKQ